MSVVRARLALVMLTLVFPVTACAVTIRVPLEQPTIQQGIDAASGGDTVLVAPDWYSGPLNRNLDFGGENITLESEDGAALTTIDCESAGRAFLFHSGEDTTAVVRGFTIAHALADTGGGAYCLNGSSPKFEACNFSYCRALSRGGALCCNDSAPVMRGCYVWWSEADDVVRQYSYGGGISCVNGSAPLIADTEFKGNFARTSGGGLHSAQSSPVLYRCDFIENTLGEYGQGAGAKLQQSNGSSFTECTFSGNGELTCVGGGLHVTGSIVDVTDCDFSGNVSLVSGGIHLAVNSYGAISGCTFINNLGDATGAGAIQCVQGSNALISNCTFVMNDYSDVWCDGTSPTIEYCIHAFTTAGPPVYCETGIEAPYIHHCFVFESPEGDTLCGGNYHDIEYADPLFCDVPGGDVTLCANSPCLPGVTWPSLVGAEGEGCPDCDNPVTPSSWGAIKASFR